VPRTGPENISDFLELQQLIMRPEEQLEGDVLTHTEYTSSKFCAEEKLKKRTPDRLIAHCSKEEIL
jgi:hypothetical protein